MKTVVRSMQIEELRDWAGHAVRVRMADGSELEGRLRTELLTDRSISVYLAHREQGTGTTLYIEEIVGVRAG
jgi:small nuclear ribonucleoprotein (snRNP)-like protein